MHNYFEITVTPSSSIDYAFYFLEAIVIPLYDNGHVCNEIATFVDVLNLNDVKLNYGVQITHLKYYFTLNTRILINFIIFGLQTADINLNLTLYTFAKLKIVLSLKI